MYNVVFQWVHRHDDHVRVWQNGEQCSGGCGQCDVKEHATPKPVDPEVALRNKLLRPGERWPEG